MATKNKPNEIYLTRIYDAPVKMVWEAWTDPKQVGKWWGPRGFTTTTHSMDFRAGGHWHHTMHGPDGTDYPNKTKFLEIEKYSRMVYDHGGNDEKAPMFRVTVTFAETGGKTKMEMTMSHPTVEAVIETKKIIKNHGGNSTWDRLAEYLSPSEKFVINRVFDAPRDLVFDMWTDPKHFSKWLPPTGFNMEFIRADIKTGGSTFYCMSGDDIKMYGKAHYKEITKPERIVYTQCFCDDKEKTTRHYMMATWPETMLTTVILSEEGPDKTRVTITWEPYGEVTAAERETFVKSKGGMTQGWGGSFEKLENYLKENYLKENS